MALLVGAWACACGGVDAGETPFAGTERAVGPSSAYSFRYLSPPWASLPGGAGIYVVLDWNAALHLDVTKVPSLDSLPVVLRVEAVGSSADGALQARAAGVSPPVPLSTVRALRTVAGIQGQELTWTDSSTNPPTHWREGYYGGSALGGRAFRMQFKGKRSLANDPLIDAMLASFGPGTSN